jgi:hypothetical protein
LKLLEGSAIKHWFCARVAISSAQGKCPLKEAQIGLSLFSVFVDDGIQIDLSFAAPLGAIIIVLAASTFDTSVCIYCF